MIEQPKPETKSESVPDEEPSEVHTENNTASEVITSDQVDQNESIPEEEKPPPCIYAKRKLQQQQQEPSEVDDQGSNSRPSPAQPKEDD